MNISEIDYTLPKELIAQEPMNPREQAKLMVVQKNTGKITHTTVAHFPSLLQPSDVLVINNTKVFHARLNVENKELFLIRPTDNGWLAIGKPGKKFTIGSDINIADDFSGTVVQKNTDGTFVVSFPYSTDEVMTKANTYGTVPIPPYIKKIPHSENYQTTYAKVIGSVAAPTAGFHLTHSLLDQIRNNGVTIVELTLHVGLGTFLPIKTDAIENHTMHSEWVHISQQTADMISNAKKDKKRIIAVGTTTTRALEGTDAHQYSGDVNIFIKPGFEFRITDGLLTNFHLPKSTLILLVSAFAGIDLIKRAYKEAIEHRYRFYSFGDAMIIL